MRETLDELKTALVKQFEPFIIKMIELTIKFLDHIKKYVDKK